MEFKNLILNNNNSIAIVSIHRPEKLNALNHETLVELDNVFDKVKTDSSVSVVVITGSGEKSFIAGADINELTNLDEKTGEEFSKFGQSVFDKIENLNKPVIAAVNGFALGGGCEIACASHIRIASQNAKFGQPEINLGIIPGYGGTQRLARIISKGQAFEMILTGVMIDADEAYRIGLVNKVLPSEQLMEYVIELAEKISIKGESTLSAVIKTVNSTDNLTQEDGLLFEAEQFGKCCTTAEFKEGTTAFLEKRKPHFKK